MLSKLAVHYYRADFTEAQARSQIGDMVQDLIEFPVPEVEMAITIYRQTPPLPGKVKYFPDSSALRAIVLEGRRDRAALDRIAPVSAVSVSRPCMWWTRPKNRWNFDWREADVPDGELIKDITGGPFRRPQGSK